MSGYLLGFLGEKCVFSNGVLSIRSDVARTEAKRSSGSLGAGEYAAQVGTTSHLGTSEQLKATPRDFRDDILFDTS